MPAIETLTEVNEADYAVEDDFEQLVTDLDRNSLPSPQWRADVKKGVWKAPDSKFKINQIIYIKLKSGAAAGPFTVLETKAPEEEGQQWRYTVRDGKGNTKSDVPESVVH